jgi:hypothetical protein
MWRRTKKSKIINFPRCHRFNVYGVLYKNSIFRFFSSPFLAFIISIFASPRYSDLINFALSSRLVTEVKLASRRMKGIKVPGNERLKIGKKWDERLWQQHCLSNEIVGLRSAIDFLSQSFWQGNVRSRHSGASSWGS